MKFLRLLSAVLLAAQAAQSMQAADALVYFGSHNPAPGAGFSLAHFDADTGTLTKPEFLLEAKEPAFFVISADGSRLYTCNSGTPGGLSSYAVEPHSGRLTLLNRVLAGGGDTSFISLDKAERHVLVANYDGGSVAVFALKPDGSIGDWTGFDQHRGQSVNPVRQTHAYAHSIVLDSTNRFALVPDLGVDKVYVYRFDAATGALVPHEPAFAAIAPGSGPRHIRFHPNGRWVYLINEIASTIEAFAWDASAGTLAPFQTVSTLPADFGGVSACAELEIHPNGKFLYGSNRGHDSVAVFAIDPVTGRLSPVEYHPCGGKTPRNFAFDPTGRWIVLTNQDSSTAVVFRVDPDSGRLTQNGDPVPVPSPFCERFLTVR
ncbi:MAG TPA: lactonase family protein [Opitutaceae bacterium]